MKLHPALLLLCLTGEAKEATQLHQYKWNFAGNAHNVIKITDENAHCYTSFAKSSKGVATAIHCIPREQAEEQEEAGEEKDDH